MVEGQAGTDLADGDEFAGYRIERRLGRGGMGILYLAVEPGLDRRVALKLIAPEAAADGVFARRFREESRIAASIEHPNVVPIYAAGEERGVPYIAMRFVAGSDLAGRLAREGRMEPAPAVALITQVGNGLDAIHAAGLVHRDVKPANVLLSGDGDQDHAYQDHAYITDFGVARNLATQSGLTQTGRFVGTLDYVAPEQIAGAEIDARVDVYALGCLLFKLLTGEVPFPREGEAARLYAHLNDPPPAPSLYAPAVPMALDDVVARALSKEPGDRYPSAGDLGRAAQAALSGSSVALPERTVATGAAATGEASTVAPAEAPGEQPTAGEATERRTSDSRDAGRRRLVVVGGLLSAAFLAVLAIVLAAGRDPDPGQAETAAGDVAREAPEPLTKAELIAAADRICVKSQRDYAVAREWFMEGETVPDVGYARELTGISKRAVAGLRALEPPAGSESAYDAYVEAQTRVRSYDRQALRAAEEGDADAYLAARAERDSEQPLRYRLARQIGLEECSLKPR
jgi:hypothetical protein